MSKGTWDWMYLEKWMVTNSDTDPLRWFIAEEIARDLNMAEDYVESRLKNYFESQSVERRSGDKGFEYRNFQHDFSVEPYFRDATLKIHVEAPKDELHAAVQQLIFRLREQEWVWEATEPEDYNDYDKHCDAVDLTFARKFR